MKLYCPALLCVYLMIAAESGIADTPGPSTSDLVKLVKSYCAKVPTSTYADLHPRDALMIPWTDSDLDSRVSTD
jgi:hypothetical protein